MVGVCLEMLPFGFGACFLLRVCPKQRKAAADGLHLPCNSRGVQVLANGTSEAENGKQYDYDFFSIGGGTGGVRAARWSAMNFGEPQSTLIRVSLLST